MVKFGPSLGYRIGSNAVVRVSGAWNNDVTDYELNINNNRDDDYFDLGIEGAWYISDTWQIKGGYNRILDLDTYDGDQFYIGSNFTF